MNDRKIDGIIFKNMLVSGLKCLKLNVEEINELNVFPIPDGDTGYNMCSTLHGGVKNILNADDGDLSNVAKTVQDGVLLGARGNSGVILSQMLYGICDEFSAHKSVDVSELGKAFSCGVKSAYASVSVPVEGTMLTVLREATQYANTNISKNTTVSDYFTNFLKAGERSLARTPELLDVLKEAGVVDSGGAGVLYIVRGFLSAVRGEDVGDYSEITATAAATKDIDFSLFNENSVMKYGYCTEFLLQLTHAKTDIAAFSLDKMKKEISVFGDSLVAVRTGSVIKIHIHTLTPGAVLEYAQAFGEFLTLKIENMTLQHNETIEKKQQFKKNAVRKKYATIAVANGKGVIATFKELGADIVIDGGQGNNPSVETFLNAFDAVNADVIFVLPDNNNIFMAAQEAAKLFEGSDVRVLNAKSAGDGYCALAALDYSSDNPDEIAAATQEAIDCAVCACISQSTRDLNSNGLDIKVGNYIGFVDKDILVADTDRQEAVKHLLKKVKADEKSFIIVFFGKGVDEVEREATTKYIKNSYSDAEFYRLDGEQEIYNYIIILQ
ncbi:MAG: DAK2 domain-containing protein [Clostridiales bacterium]|nr:DAK2 domain-containing protein [Clostridiales bacterium]